ncbi:unnamed protein product, partial [Laminaria digitata]
SLQRLSHVAGLPTERKNIFVQMMRNHMYQGRKRPRSGGDSTNGFPMPPTTTTSGGPWLPRGAGVTPSAGVAGLGVGAAVGAGAGASLAAPARHYTTTQPDIEDAGSSGGGGGVFAPLRTPLFAPEELAPTYHYAAATPNGGSGGGVGREVGGGGGGGQQVVLGCPHYRRACKMLAPCCQRLFTCRLCHDQASDHTVDREEVKEMLCMRCGTLQPMHSECRNPSCRPTDAEEKSQSQGNGRRMARYYCGICHLFDDAPAKDIYHCPYCNMCRLGKGLGVVSY